MGTRAKRRGREVLKLLGRKGRSRAKLEKEKLRGWKIAFSEPLLGIKI